ncbi:MAG: hypothetical protein EXR00_01110 [Alphaproteobacteria bacterium]|nr:hypothetical protein [Alphaproteobacteria bacterium]
MSSFTGRQRLLAGAILASLLGMAPMVSTLAQQQAAPPDFSSNLAGWIGLNGGGPFFEAAPGRVPGPVVSDPAHPFVPNGTDKQPTFRIADLSNPNLMPWVKEYMKKDIDEILAGKKPAFTAQSSCWPSGVPGFMGYGGPDPIVFLQTPKIVWLMWQEDNQSRRIYMNVPHSANPKPSWYGESVGRYEGDTLVIDTIGLSDKTFVDIYRTPHTEKLHVVERWRMIDGGRMMEVIFTVEDTGAFYQPWTGMRRYRRVTQEAYEKICAENNTFNLIDYKVPSAEKPDF